MNILLAHSVIPSLSNCKHQLAMAVFDTLTANQLTTYVVYGLKLFYL